MASAWCQRAPRVNRGYKRSREEGTQNPEGRAMVGRTLPSDRNTSGPSFVAFTIYEYRGVSPSTQPFAANARRPTTARLLGADGEAATG
jgi:hypothetical protein